MCFTKTASDTSLENVNLWYSFVYIPLRWHHNGRDSDSNHQLHSCLLNRLFRRRSRKTSEGIRTGEFPTQEVSNMENISIWWRHHSGYVLSSRARHLFSLTMTARRWQWPLLCYSSSESRVFVVSDYSKGVKYPQNISLVKMYTLH